jgi:hypothetical protein
MLNRQDGLADKPQPSWLAARLVQFFIAGFGLKRAQLLKRDGGRSVSARQ